MKPFTVFVVDELMKCDLRRMLFSALMLNRRPLSLLDRISRESKKVFEDVVEDFHSLDFIKSHFEVWRRDYADCYRDAYIGLCLPRLFNPLVRLEVITWNPLEVGHVRVLSVQRIPFSNRSKRL